MKPTIPPRKNSPMDASRAFWDQIEELRKLLIRVLCVISIGMFCSFIFYKPIISLLTQPLFHNSLEKPEKFHLEKREQTRITNTHSKLLAYRVPRNADAPTVGSQQVKKLSRREYLLPPGDFLEFTQPAAEQELIILSPPEGLMIALRTSFWVGLVGTSPLWMLLILSYIAPALLSSEKRALFPFFLFSLLFLTFGFLFAFFITIPSANHYLSLFNEALGRNLWSLSLYLDYTLILLLANGLAFEIFAVLFILVQYEWISASAMKANRKVVFLAFLVLSALITPPDAVTQLLLAFPLMGFYELAIVYGTYVVNKKRSTSHKKDSVDYFE